MVEHRKGCTSKKTNFPATITSYLANQDIRIQRWASRRVTVMDPALRKKITTGVEVSQTRSANFIDLMRMLSVYKVEKSYAEIFSPQIRLLLLSASGAS